MKVRFFGWVAAIGLSCLGLGGCGESESDSPSADDQKPAEGKGEGVVQDWPLFRGDAEMRGVSAEDLAPPLELVWSYEVPVAEGKHRIPIQASPVISQGRIYYGGQDGYFYCLDLKTGKPVWTARKTTAADSKKPGDPHQEEEEKEKEKKKTDDAPPPPPPIPAFDAAGPIIAPAAVFGGRVYFGDTYGYIFCLDAETGEEIWKVETFDKVEGGVNAFEVEGKLRVYVGSHDTSLYCIDAETAEIIWQLETGQPIISTPSIASELPGVVFGGCDAVLHVVSGETSDELFALEVNNYIGNSVAIADGIAYVANYGGEVLAVDLESGETAWKKLNAGVEYHGSPAVTGKLMIVPGNDKRLVAYDRVTGDEVWTFTAPRDFESSPVACESAIWIGGMDGRLYAVDPTDGTELWNYDVGAQIFASPALSDGTLVICGEDGVVYAFRKVAETEK